MYIFRNSMKNLIRNKGRNVLIFLILLVTMTAVTICTIVQQTAKTQVEDVVQSFNPKISMTEDYTKLSEDYPSKEIIGVDGSTYWEAAKMPDYLPSMEMLEKWGKSDYVDHMEWWIECEYFSDYNSIENESSFGTVEDSEYYGKDINYFRKMAETDYETKRVYYLSELFQSSDLYKRMFESGHIVTDSEAAELAARTIFGEEHYKEYLEGGISDRLAEVALEIKIGYSGVLQIYI